MVIVHDCIGMDTNVNGVFTLNKSISLILRSLHVIIRQKCIHFIILLYYTILEIMYKYFFWETIYRKCITHLHAFILKKQRINAASNNRHPTALDDMMATESENEMPKYI